MSRPVTGHDCIITRLVHVSTQMHRFRLVHCVTGMVHVSTQMLTLTVQISSNSHSNIFWPQDQVASLLRMVATTNDFHACNSIDET